MSSLASYWNTLSHLGADLTADQHDRRHVILCNQINLLLIGTLIPFYPLQLWVLGADAKAHVTLVLALALGLSLFLNKKGATLTSRIITGSVTPLFVYAASLFTKTSMPADVSLSFIDYLEPRIFILCIAGLPFILFDLYKDRLWLIISFFTYLGLMLGGEWIDAQMGVSIHARDINFDNRISLVVSPALAFVATAGGYLFFVIMGRKYEHEMSQANKDLSIAEEEVRQNLEELQSVQERLTKQEKKLSIILDNLPTALTLTNPEDGRIIMANQEAKNLLKHPTKANDDLVGQYMTDFYVEEDGRKKLLEAIAKNDAKDLRLLAHSYQGPTWISAYATPIQVNSQTLIMAAFINIEKQLEFEDELKKQSTALKGKNEELQTMEEELRQNVEELQAQRDFVEQANKQVQQRNKTINRHSKILMGLSKHNHIQKGNWAPALELLTNTASQVLSIERVSIWKYDALAEELYCEKLFEKDSFSYQDGAVIPYRDASPYFDTFMLERILQTTNVYDHPQTQDLYNNHLAQHDVQSTLDATYLINGEVKGIVRCEHIGSPREWQPEEVSFIKAIAEMLSLVYQNTQQAKANIYVRKSTEILSQLAKNDALIRGDWMGFLEEITQQCAHHGNISRVSVWEYNAKDKENTYIKCLKLYEKKTLTYSEGLELRKADFPEYFRSISRQQPIIADKAREHIATSCFNVGYFDVLDIYSLLDVPYFVNGDIKGVICCEQQGNIRFWSLEDQLFIKSLADLVTVAYQNAVQIEQQEAISQTNHELVQTQARLEQNLLDLENTRKILADQKEALDIQHKNTLHSIEYAQTMQQAILPPMSTQKKVFPESFVIYKPKDIVSGDFYWISEYEGKKVLAVIDCTGHGVPGAFMSIIGYNLLSEIILQQHCYNPPEILTRLHQGITQALRQNDGANDDGMDLSICILEEQEDKRIKVTFEGAKSNLLYISGSELKMEKGTRRSIGGRHASQHSAQFKSKEVLLEKGDMIYLTTDGLQDQNNESRRRFSSQRLSKLIKDVHLSPVEQQKITIEANLKEFMGNAVQRDDITFVGVKL